MQRAKIPIQILNLFIFSSVYIGLCAVIMIIQANQLLHLQYDHPRYLLFVFFSTICSYNFHWYLTPDAVKENDRTAWTLHHKKLHIVLVICGLLGSAWCFFAFFDSWLWMAVPVVLTFLYSAPKLPYKPFVFLKKVAIGKTLFLAFVWMYVTTLLPLILSKQSVTGTGILFCCSRFFLIYAICILFDYRDRENDKREGIRSMITYFSEKGVDNLFYASLAAFLLSTLGLLTEGFTMITVLFLLLPGLAVLLLFRTAKQNFSDYLYYFVLDGLMMFSAILTFFLRF